MKIFMSSHGELPSVLNLAELEGTVGECEGESTNGVEEEDNEIPLGGVLTNPVEPKVNWDE